MSSLARPLVILWALAACPLCMGAGDEVIRLAPGDVTRANAWTEVELPAAQCATSSAPESVRVEIADPWGQIIWTGVATGPTCSFFSRAWADGRYTLRTASGTERAFRVDTEYFDSIRARAGLMLRAIDARRDAAGLPPKEWRGASNLLQRIVTLHLWREPRDKVEQHMSFCEQQLGFRTAAATVRMLGTGAANVPGYTGPYRPLARERNMMFVPPDAVFDFSDFGERKLTRWGYSPAKIGHVFISHVHADHFDAPAIAAFAQRRIESGAPPIVLHAGAAVCHKMREHLEGQGGRDSMVVDEVGPGSRIRAGELQVEAVRANHQLDSDPLCYVASWRGMTVYYGTDTGYPGAETYAALAARKFDLFAHEITAASADDGIAHTDLGDFQLLVGRLRAAGAIGTWTRVISMHQSPEGPQILPDYAHFQQAIGFECGYDGMPVPIAYRLDDASR